MEKSINVFMKRENVYKHLRAICNNGKTFTIIDHENWADSDYERIIISDQQSIIAGKRRLVIGSIRLLPSDDGTTIMFVAKDAIWNTDISEEGRNLFLDYISLVITHFKTINKVIGMKDEAVEELDEIVNQLCSAKEELLEIKIPKYPQRLRDMIISWSKKVIPLIKHYLPEFYSEFESLIPSETQWTSEDVFIAYNVHGCERENAWKEDQHKSEMERANIVNFLDGLIKTRSKINVHNRDKIILLITVTEIETKAVINLFSKEIVRIEKGKKIFYDLGIINNVKIMLGQSEMGSSTIGGSIQTIEIGIKEFKPLAVIMVGIAFGTNNQEQSIGDILVSQRIIQYEIQKINQDVDGNPVVIPRWERIHSSMYLLGKFRSGALDWFGSPISFGNILSGEKLINNITFRDKLLDIEPEAIGGEMEGVGVFVACESAKVNWIVVKGVCDFADGNKDKDKKKNQLVAAQNAAQFVLHVIKNNTWN